VLKHFSTCLILFLFLISIVVHAEETDYEKTEREAAEYKMNRIKEKAQELDVEINFYGKVVDQNGDPVKSADVALGLTRFSPLVSMLFGGIKIIHASTDEQGRFSIIGEKGRSIDLDKIKKEGYEYAISQNPVRAFDYSGVQNPFNPDQTNPVVFHLRKKGEATFLIKELDLRLTLDVAESGKSVGFDLIRRVGIDDISKPMFNGERLTCDLKMTATYNETNKTWSVVLMPGDTNGGILASSQLLYEAPPDGYQNEYAFVAEGSHNLPATKYIYLRSRDPAIYSRFEIEFAAVGDDIVQIMGNSVTNPYGDRNLEQATDLPYAVDKQLSDEIRSAYKQNKRPAKPDLQKLINEAKGKTSQ
jgi:hypothetical protein